MTIEKNELSPGDPAPKFTLPGSGQTDISLEDYKGNKLVLYFYPRDDTPGCTKQAIGFSSLAKEFAAEDTMILGVSGDSVSSHEKFISKHDIAIPLASDEETQTLEAYGVWVEKNMYGRKFMGVERATYLINRDGKISQIWRKVKVPGHVEVVLQAAKGLA